jgi:hypothetical protein
MHHGRAKGDNMTYYEGKRKHDSRERQRELETRTFHVARNRYDHFVAWLTIRRLV